MSHNRQKKIAVVNDFCGFGRCSLTVSIPIISAMRLQCCPVPTAIFSNHTGYESFFCTDYTDSMEAYIAQWKKLELCFDGILTGFLGSPEQIGIVKRFLEAFKKEGTTVVVDPVMGDNGKLYATYSPALAQKMRELLPFADILTPNLTEACILSGVSYRTDLAEGALEAICEKLSAMGPEKIVVSGLERGDTLENFVYETGKPPLLIREARTGPGRAGTGDVFSSLLVADAVNGVAFAESVRRAAAFIAKVVKATTEQGIPETDGLCFENFLTEL